MNSRAASLPPPDEEARIVIDLMDGFRASKAVFTAVSLGVFDRLHRAAASCAELAEALRCQPHALERILGACVALRLLTIQNGRYHNQKVATRFLRVESPETMAGYILYSDRVLFRLWSHLEEAVREGTHRWEQEFGRREAIFEHFFSSEEDKLTFLAGMHGQGLLSSPAAAAAFNLAGFCHLVDVGGGTGHLVIEACRRYPQLRGTVFDLAPVVPVAKSYVEAAGLTGRIDVMAGDFFKDPFPEADLYSVGRILHDWPDEKVNFLVQKAYDHLPAGGGLMICEKTLNEERDGPAGVYLQSLNMLVCTEGKERTASEYESLTRAAGFKDFEIVRTGQPVDAMLARK
jgi:acetylserotonin N-methyltransferase